MVGISGRRAVFRQSVDDSSSKSRGTSRDWSSVHARDRKIVAACLAGDEDAWTALWETYGPMVKAVARRAGCNDDDVSEVLQRTALIALQGLGRLRQPEKLAGWLAGIARFQVIELRRSRRPASELTETSAVTNGAFDEDLVVEQETARLYAALKTLDERCQRIVIRLELDDPPASYQEVAAEVGLASTSIGPIRGRCLKKLRRQIEVSRK